MENLEFEWTKSVDVHITTMSNSAWDLFPMEVHANRKLQDL